MRQTDVGGNLKNMEYNKIRIWIKGYLDAIKDGSGITKEQLKNLANRLNEMIEKIEKNRI